MRGWLALPFGAAVGAAVGLAVQVVMTGTPWEMAATLVEAPSAATLAFLLLGSALGIGLAGELSGALRLAGVIHLAFGVVAGAFSGLALYAVGYALGTQLFAHPDRPLGPELALYLLDSVYSATWVQLILVGVGATIGILVVRSDWRFYGVLAYVALVSVVVGYLGYAVLVSLPLVEPAQLPLSLLLLVAETASLGLVVLYAFYSLDVSMRRRWRRLPDGVPFSKYYVPKVAFHVTVFNEPAEMVLQTLAALERVEYPADRRVIMVLDDSTEEDTRGPVSAYCAERGHLYVRRPDRRGYKAGALNHALTVTPADVEILAVIDADFQVEPEYLRETVGYFINPNLGFVQTPQDYRNRHQSFLTEQYYHADAYFYRAILPARNEENTIIFCGTMGLIRRGALTGVGGWSEDCVTEDSELSVRLLERGYDSLYVNKTYGRGLMPPLFEAYKKQLHRWSFGGVQILRRHLRRFLVGRMSLRQKSDFLVGSLHWFDGIFVLVIALALAALAVGDLLEMPVLTYHQREVWLVGLVPFFLLLDGVTRLHLAMRRATQMSLFDTLKVLGIWYAIKFNNMFAAGKAFAGAKIPFVRTPKAPGERIGRWQALRRAIRLTPFETGMMLLLLTLAVAQGIGAARLAAEVGVVYATRAMLIVWLLHYALIFACAPLYAYKAYVTFVPDRELFPPASGAIVAGRTRNRNPALPDGSATRNVPP